MSEVENTVEVDEVPEDAVQVDAEEVQVSNVESVIDSILQGDFSAAGQMFTDEMNDRIADALDAKRVEVGATMAFDDVDGETDEEEYEYEEDTVEDSIEEDDTIQ